MLCHKLCRIEPKTMVALLSITNKYALAEEADQMGPAELL
jgi:hypothetical protein